MKLSHKQKTKLARKLRTIDEVKRGVPIFSTKAWQIRKEGKLAKVYRKIEEAQQRKKDKQNEKTK